MYGHCFFNRDEGSLVADMSTRLLPEGIQQVEGILDSAGGGSMPPAAARGGEENPRMQRPKWS
jgi:hypothetical protein